MVFIGGPRRVGKTTLSLHLLDPKKPSETHQGYLNWDDLKDRKSLLRGEIKFEQKLIVFDEIHKFKNWRNLIKGFYDKNKSMTSFLITGSARLDYYRKGGDSLQGRYHYYRLHPFSLGEMKNFHISHMDLQTLLRFGGFPEPLFKQDSITHKRWQRERLERVIYQDIRDLENIKEISLIELLIEHLPSCVGSPLSIKSLKDLIQVSHESVERWIKILERLYVCFRISPFGAPKIRAVKKEQKIYFWDWSQVENSGARFENLVASHLLKFCHFREDTQGVKMELRYIRDTDKREIDFVVLENKKPLFAIECKSGEKNASPHHKYFRERTLIPFFFQVHLGTRDHGNASTGVRVLPFASFCKELQLP
ncbi:MAG: ATP-binding protein [Deltaproteobacteria bacterium]|nr:ATP-binding protein [Deltaproteobacteria bacterium]